MPLLSTVSGGRFKMFSSRHRLADGCYRERSKLRGHNRLHVAVRTPTANGIRTTRRYIGTAAMLQQSVLPAVEAQLEEFASVYRLHSTR